MRIIGATIALAMLGSANLPYYFDTHHELPQGKSGKRKKHKRKKNKFKKRKRS